MFTDEVRRAIAVAPREQLGQLSGAIWKAFAAGAIGDDEAQGLADAIEARKVVPVLKTAPRRVGSRPRTPESMERRRRWVASGLMPPQIASRFSMGECAALAVIAAEVAKKRSCRLTLGHIAAIAGVCKTTVRNAVREAQALGLIKSEEWRLSAWRSAPNTVTILSAEWTAWLRLTRHEPTWVQNRGAHAYGFKKPSGETRTAAPRPARKGEAGTRRRTFDGGSDGRNPS